MRASTTGELGVSRQVITALSQATPSGTSYPYPVYRIQVRVAVLLCKPACSMYMLVYMYQYMYMYRSSYMYLLRITGLHAAVA